MWKNIQYIHRPLKSWSAIYGLIGRTYRWRYFCSFCVFFTPKLIRFFVKVSFKKVSFWEILLISALDININVDDTSTVLQFASSFQLLVLDTFDSCRKCQLRYICDLHIIHHYLYKKCTCFCNKVHHKRKTKPYIDRFITAVILVVIAVKSCTNFNSINYKWHFEHCLHMLVKKL